MTAAVPCPCVFARESSCGHHDDCHRRARWGRDLAVHQFGDQDQNHDHRHQDEDHRDHPVAHQDPQDEAWCVRDWPTRNDPCGPPNLGVVRRLGVDRAHHLVADEQEVVARDCHLEVVESCVHRQERCVVLMTVVFLGVALVYPVPLVVALRAHDSGLTHRVEMTPLVVQETRMQETQAQKTQAQKTRMQETLEQMAQWKIRLLCSLLVQQVWAQQVQVTLAGQPPLVSRVQLRLLVLLRWWPLWMPWWRAAWQLWWCSARRHR